MSDRQAALDIERFRLALLAELRRNWPELSALHDDLAQEGVIKALAIARDDLPISYYLTAARRRWERLIRGAEPWTGSEGSTRTYRARTHADDDILTTADRAVDPAHTDVDVRSAVAALPAEDRRLVWLRFWEDLAWPEVAEAEQLPRNTPRNRWATHLRPALAERLAS